MDQYINSDLQENANPISMAFDHYILAFSHNSNVPTYMMSNNPQGERDVHKEVKTNNFQDFLNSLASRKFKKMWLEKFTVFLSYIINMN